MVLELEKLASATHGFGSEQKDVLAAGALRKLAPVAALQCWVPGVVRGCLPQVGQWHCGTASCRVGAEPVRALLVHTRVPRGQRGFPPARVALLRDD